MAATLVEIESHIKTLEEKLGRMKSGEIKGESDAHTAQNISRVEAIIRQHKTELAALQPKKGDK